MSPTCRAFRLAAGLDGGSQTDYHLSQVRFVAGVDAMPTVNVHEAKTHLSRLLAQVEAGQEVVIARRGAPVARLVACEPRGKRQADVLKGRITVPDSFFEPLPEEELRLWEGR